MPAEMFFVCFSEFPSKALPHHSRIKSLVNLLLSPLLLLTTAFNLSPRSITSAELFLLASSQKSAEREELR